MKRFIALVLAISSFGIAIANDLVDFSNFQPKPHPRLFLDNAEFQSLNALAKEGSNPYFAILDERVLDNAETIGMKANMPVFKLDRAGRRLLAVSRETLTRVFSLAYAYRRTGKECYLRQAEEIICAVCSFDSWNPSHFLDVGEMAAAVAIGYDWLYDGLHESTKELARKAIAEKALDIYCEGKSGKWNENDNNWNQVCYGGLVCACMAFLEDHPQKAQTIVSAALADNKRAVEHMYAPDGAYAEGAGYWEYGTSYQSVLNCSLESVLGTDFGLFDTQGFSGTGYFQNAMFRDDKYFFNYSDNRLGKISCLPLWYFAWKCDQPELVYTTSRMMPKGKITDKERLLPLYAIFASRVDATRVKPLDRLSYVSKDAPCPVAVFRTGWESTDTYLGVKGGSGKLSHSHLDAGGFVYDRFGIRWAAEISIQPYADVEKPLKSLGGNLWDRKQESLRWGLFRYNNRQHNTLTVNGENHEVEGGAYIVDVYDSADRHGVALEMTELFGARLALARREVCLLGDESLEVKDILKASSSTAKVRFTFVSDAMATLCKEGIILEKDGRQMLLKAAGAKVKYRIWSSDPADYNMPTARIEKPVPQTICGFEFSLPKSASLTVTTTLRPLRMNDGEIFR